MNCPKCNVTLVMTERQGVEIDYCLQCRGVWLDRGELDKIIERSVAPGYGNNPYEQHGYHDDDDHHNRHHDSYKHSKHKSWLQGFFD